MLKPAWTADVVKILHQYEVSREQLADLCGISRSYLSEVLNGRECPEGLKDRIMVACVAIKQNTEY